MTIPKGTVFTMGDNRDQSNDSRFFGMVDLKDVLGKVFIIYWPWNRENHDLRSPGKDASCSSSGDAEKKTPNSLARVFVPEMLNANLPYFERVTGPARNTYGNINTYLVDGCEVTATIANGSVRALSVGLSPKCTFDLNQFVHASSGKFPPPHTMTFGQFDALIGGGQFMASCLTLCGNAADPSVYEHWRGSHADGYLEVMPEIVLATDIALDASKIWEDAMIKGEGENWVIETKFNCGFTKYDEIAHNAFKNVRITAITVGYEIAPQVCD
jgi:hypothetical protein